MSERAVKPIRFGTKLVLLAGFGGVLGLMALAGLDSVRALHKIEAENTRITSDYLMRHHLLEQIRSTLYLSSTFVRDYLTESSPQAAQASLAGLRGLRGRMQTALAAYGQGMREEEQRLFLDLKNQVNGYWSALTPIFEWQPEERRAEGFRFLQMRVLPHRTVILDIADKVDVVNEQALSGGNRRSAELFRSFRARIMSILALTLGIGMVLATASIVHILRLEREAQARYEEIGRAQAELKRLSARLVDAQEEERRAISRELHDQVGQSLNALLLDLGNLVALTPAESRQARQLLDTAKRLTEESVKQLRDLALLLRPSMLDDFGLVPALHWLAREMTRRTGMRVDVAADEVADELPDEHKTCVYRVVQEALQNVSRHAAAQKVRVTVQQQPDRLLLTIEDDGAGFDAERIRGLGLLGMEERVKHLEGTFKVQSHAGQGTMLKVELPLAARGVEDSARHR